jgi:hypothetical protein
MNGARNVRRLPETSYSIIRSQRTISTTIRTRARPLDTRVIISAYLSKEPAMITHVCRVIRPKGSDLVFDHPYNADSACL